MKRKTMTQRVEEYLQFKRHLGFKMRSQAYELEAFAKYADENALGKPLSVKLALQWATLPQTHRAYHAARWQVLSAFAKYLISDDPRTELLPGRVICSEIRRRTPYIFSQNEISVLMNTSPYSKQTKINALTYSTILGLLASSGMRIGEVLALKNGDIDWKQRLISIHNSKKVGIRVIPVNQSVLDHLRKYAECRDSVFQNRTDDHFFLSSNGRRFCYASISESWRKLRQKTGVGKSSPIVPRLHDFRHSFACNHLLSAYKKNKNIDTAVHILSIYLGHEWIGYSYWYLTGVPELLYFVSKKTETITQKKMTGT
jgi:integrase